MGIDNMGLADDRSTSEPTMHKVGEFFIGALFAIAANAVLLGLLICIGETFSTVPTENGLSPILAPVLLFMALLPWLVNISVLFFLNRRRRTWIFVGFGLVWMLLTGPTLLWTGCMCFGAAAHLFG